LIDAVQDQLGLKLIPAKGRGRVLVVDHVEKPTSVDGAELPSPPAAALTPVAFAQASPAATPAYYAAEQMQKANDLQAAGKIDAAIQIYRQVLGSAPSRQFAAQAQFHLAQALLQKGDLQGAAQEFQVLSQSYPEYKDLVASMTAQMRSGSPREYGVLADGRFHNFLTDIELAIPDGYTFAGCFPSSGDGEQAILRSQSRPNVEVWMRPVAGPIADLRAELRKEMIRKPADRGEGWKERPESAQERTISGKPGISVVADYMNNGKPWVEYLIWINTGKTFTQFFGQAPADQLAVLQQGVDTVANSAVIP
jgi:tetratricopeptide (TPR) repeat protein